jgi:hypothetical protein
MRAHTLTSNPDYDTIRQSEERSTKVKATGLSAAR